MTSSTAATHLLLDANVLLHFMPPDQVDWPVLCGATEVVLVIYPLLRSELSKAKDLHPNKTIRRRAGEREAWLRERLRRPSDPIRPGVWLRRDVDEARGLIAGFDLDPQLADDLIVALALRLRGEGRDVCVVTADGGLEMKLEDRGIPVIVPDDRLRLQPEPDPERLRAERAERELRAQRDSLPGLVVSWRRSAPLTRQAGLGDSDGYVEEALCDFYITSLTNIKTAY